MKSLFKENFSEKDLYFKNVTLKPLAHEEKDADFIIANTPPILHHKVVGGHLPYWFFRYKDPEFKNSYFITVLRDPIDRVLSSYRFRRQTDRNTALFDMPTNVMCRMLSSDITLQGEDLLQDCIKTLHRMDFIIFHDNFDEEVWMLFNELGLNIKYKEIPKTNSTVPYAIDAKSRKKLENIHNLDIKLYKYALTHFR